MCGGIGRKLSSLKELQGRQGIGGGTLEVDSVVATQYEEQCAQAFKSTKNKSKQKMNQKM